MNDLSAQEYNRALDTQLSEFGNVNSELFSQLIDAYNYDAASSIGWLKTKLNILKSKLSQGEVVIVYSPNLNQAIKIENIVEFNNWVNLYFPNL
jgi:hypothetical protein